MRFLRRGWSIFISNMRQGQAVGLCFMATGGVLAVIGLATGGSASLAVGISNFLGGLVVTLFYDMASRKLTGVESPPWP